MNTVKNHSDISLFKLTWPIWVENMLRVTISSVDVFMLSFYSEKAVAAVGLINQFVFFLQVLYMMIVIGSGILISQHLGAGKKDEAATFALGSVTLGIISSVILGFLVCFTAEPILKLYSLEKEVYEFALRFMVIFGAGSLFMAMSIVFGTILRSYGYSKVPMVVNIIANIINIAGNYIAIFSPFGLPVTGVTGVAVATVFSQFCAFCILGFLVKNHKEINLPLRKMFKLPWEIYRRILSIGVPTAGEHLSYNVGQIVIMKIIAMLGTNAMSASVYALTLLRYVFMNAVSIGNGTQIKVGYFVGAGRHDEAHLKVYRYFFIGVILTTILVSIIYIAHVPLIGIFTKNVEVVTLISGVLVVALIHEPGRNFNVIIIPALKGSGDVNFPVYVGMIFMWGIGVFFAYIFGIVFGLGLTGVWIALTCDEWIRGLVMFFRWRNGKWRSKTLVVAPAAC